MKKLELLKLVSYLSVHTVLSGMYDQIFSTLHID